MGGAASEAGSARLRDALRAHHAGALGWALACAGRDRDVAAEALQSAYARILSGAARYDERSAFRTWLFGVIRTTTLELRSRGARRAARHVALDDAARAESLPPDDAVAAAQRARALSDALSELDGRQAEVVHLVFYEGLTLDDAADALGVSPGTARTHYDRGKKRLLELLREKGITS